MWRYAPLTEPPHSDGESVLRAAPTAPELHAVRWEGVQGEGAGEGATWLGSLTGAFSRR